MKRNRKVLIEDFEQEWTCPITSMPMVDPVITLDGHSYQKSDISEWLKKQKTSPKTGLKLSSGQVVPNIVLKNVIQRFQKEFKYQFDKICNQNHELNQKIQELQEKVKTSVKEKNMAQNDFKEMKTKYSELLNNSKKIGDSFLQYKKDNQSLKVQIQGLRAENNLLKSEKNNIESLKSQNRRLKQESQKSLKQKQFLIIQNQSLIQQKIQNTAEIAKLKNSNDVLKSQNFVINDQLKQEKTNLGKKTLQHQGIKKQYQKVKQQYRVLTDKYKLLQNTIQVHKQKTEKQLSVNDSLKQKQIQRLKNECNKFKIQNINLKNEIKDASSNLSKLKLQNERLKNCQSFLQNQKHDNQQFRNQQKIQKERHVSQPYKYMSRYNSINQLIRGEVQKKMQKIQEQSKKIRNVLPIKGYFDKYPVTYDEQKQQLDHSGIKINMEEFLKYNWSQLQTLNISDSQLNDRGLQLLADEAIYFNNLNNLYLWSNKIVHVPKFSLERFKNLKAVYFSLKGRYPNPLSQESKQYLKTFENKYSSSIKIGYQNKPL